MSPSKASKDRHTPSPARRALLVSVFSAGALGCGGEEDIDARRSLANSLAQAGAGGTTGGDAVGLPSDRGGSGAEPTGAGGAASAPAAPPPPAAAPNPEDPSGPPQECNGPGLPDVPGTPAPATGLLMDFASYLPMPAGTWGDSGLGQLTGGTSLYSGTPAGALTVAPEGGALHLTANLAAMGDYTGIVLWFGPCVNAAAFSGLTFPVAGTLDGARMLVKTQTSPDYPVDARNMKGKCPFEREDMKFTSCLQPTATISDVSVSPLVLPWDQFVGGQPLVTPDPQQLLGFELQFQCQAAAGGCELDVAIGTVSFVAP